MPVTTPSGLPPGERLRRAGIAAWSIIGIVILLGFSLWALLRIRIIFPPLVLALLIIYLVNPIVTRFESRGVPRPLGAVLCYVLVLGTATLVILAAAPFVSAQIAEFAEEWPALRRDLVATVEGVGSGIEDRVGIEVPTEQLACVLGVESARDPNVPSPQRCDRLTREFREQLGAQAGRITEIGLGVLEAALIFVIAPLLALYLLIDLPQVRRDLVRLVPETHRAEVMDLGSKVTRAVGGFFRGQLLVALLVGVLSAIGFRIIGLPFWLVIGAIAGFFNLVPLVGPFIGGGIGFLVGFVSEGIGLGLQAAAVELVVQQLDNHFISPQVMSRTVRLHPATVMLSLLAGGAIAGFWGVLLGVPAVAVIRLLLAHFWSTRVLGVETSPLAPAPAGAAPGGEASSAPEENRDPHRQEAGSETRGEARDEA